MKSKGFKVVVGLLVVAIVIVGGFLVVKNVGGTGVSDSPVTQPGGVSEGIILGDAAVATPDEGPEGDQPPSDTQA